MAKTLTQLISLLNDYSIAGRADITISSITYDSRRVSPGALFICLRGNKVDGHDYVGQACRAGAVAVIAEQEVIGGPEVTVIKVADSRRAMQIMAPYFFDYPSRKLRVIGVTGTNGKTTTTYLLYRILQQAGFKAGLIGTIQTLIGDEVHPGKNTTPDVIDLQSILAEMVNNGVQYAVMEVSSHALALNRVAGCEFDVGIFTNLTRDHLDFHHDFAAYLAAKARLFRLLSEPQSAKTGKTAVINLDDPAAPQILANVNCRRLTYGINNPADLTAGRIRVQAAGTELTVSGPFGELKLTLNLVGMFNVYNVLAAMGAAVAEGIEITVIQRALNNFTSVAGRFEPVRAGQPYAVIVDYAHTPDGLENILRTARQIAKRKIIVVFGCGGDRDRTKRPLMGEIAVRYADHIIVTSDNPRTENPERIIAEIKQGIADRLPAGKICETLPDRRSAIKRAIAAAQADDIVIIAGKGHETYQILGDKTIDFDDREVARECIRGMS